MTELHLIIAVFATAIGNIFLALDAITFADTNFSIFDVFIAIWLLELIVWFILRFITAKDSFTIGEEYESEGAKYQQYGETAYTSATADEIDFSESIEHE